jgi:hypothetical protein
MQGVNVAEIASETWVAKLLPSPLRRRAVKVAGRGKYDKWRRWLDGAEGEANGKITNEVVAMHARRVPWREITRLANNRDLPAPGAYWWEWVVDCYVVTQSVAIRRQLDQGPNAVSLGRMLRELVDHPGIVTRELWLSSWRSDDEHDVRLANKQWDEHFAGTDDPDVLDPELPAADLQALVEGGHQMREYVNRHVAHMDGRGSKTLPTYNDIDDAIDLIGTIFRRYHGLMMAAAYTQLEPAFQDDWAAPLRTAWLPPRGRRR